MSVSIERDVDVKDSRRAIADICVLDDDPAMLEMVRETMTSFGCRSFGTSDPQEALEYVAEGKGRVILCDMKTPTMDGLAFLEAALHLDPGST